MKRRYRDLNTYLRERFGERVQKISLDAGLGCPNRDGTLSTKGCIFCDRRGSGTGAMVERGESVEEQVQRGRAFAQKRYGARKFIAYFQSFTNTYASPSRLKDLYDCALGYPDMVGLAVATRPDCVGPEVLGLLRSYAKDHLVWVEYGLQSAHDSTLQRINRGHDVAWFDRSVRMSHDLGLDVCAHVILGLPGEDPEMMMETARHLAGQPIQGVKIHLLYVARETRLCEMHERGELRCLERGEYVRLVVDFLELLPPGVVIHRLTGEPVLSDLVAPAWAGQKSVNLKAIREELERRDTWQGRLYRNSTAQG